MRRIFKYLSALVFRKYALSRIYVLDLAHYKPRPTPAGLDCRRISREDVETCAVARIRDRAGYGGENSDGFAVYDNGSIVCMCWFWNEHRFQEPLWSLRHGEVIMVDLLTLDSHRGQGLAPALTNYAANEFKKDGKRRLVTWVWHSNDPSIRSFAKAGWSFIAFVIEIQFRGTHRVSRFCRYFAGRRSDEDPSNTAWLQTFSVKRAVARSR